MSVSGLPKIDNNDTLIFANIDKDEAISLSSAKDTIGFRQLRDFNLKSPDSLWLFVPTFNGGESLITQVKHPLIGSWIGDETLILDVTRGYRNSLTDANSRNLIVFDQLRAARDSISAGKLLYNFDRLNQVLRKISEADVLVRSSRAVTPIPIEPEEIAKQIGRELNKYPETRFLLRNWSPSDQSPLLVTEVVPIDGVRKLGFTESEIEQFVVRRGVSADGRSVLAAAYILGKEPIASIFKVDAGSRQVTINDAMTIDESQENPAGSKRQINCAVCDKVASHSCSKCRNVHYCSIECQRRDWVEKHGALC